MSNRAAPVRHWPIALALIGSLIACAPPDPSGSSARAACGLSPEETGRYADIPPGSFIKGASPLYADETPSLRLQVDGFRIQTHEVTNAQFAAFVAATGYVTDAERSVLAGRDGAGSAVFLPANAQTGRRPEWQLMADARWNMPLGAESSINARENHPVVHVSKRDAEAYADWAGGRLPSEIEWEYAASLGLPDPSDQSSGAYSADGPRANTWQGMFPAENLEADGFSGTAPVGCFEADAQGLYDMIGNVWEWTDTPFGEGTHTMKGGSFLCADNFCRRYRPAARHPQDSDFSSNHIGFRIVKDAP